ncbi:major facilitator superfamily MFS_1 [Thermosinus carboxydivorans Nor1]|uniref:Major facilitator superfamily MFS_1 n=1 Tax=Thermosinus carboxydivorans Nor1 TaxID=401526 RepID=A1HM36_9FIRM|nr:MFS transporter [Thermosinus carboxydivorans]EAX48887.1 major facilitator superfamily MFS_1 [Thermosinus carboxydivorans Nor1]
MEPVLNQELANRAMDKAQRKIVPFILLMYVLAFLDRANIGFAKNALQLDTGLSDAAFAMGAGIFFLGYAIFEVPSNIIMHHVGARRWLARIMFTWGIVAAGFAWAKTETIFLSLRVLLGIAEAGFFPGIIYYLTFWFTERRRSSIMGLFYFGAPLCFIFGSPLSGLLMDMDGVLGIHGWQWMFVVEGLLASIVGVWAFWYLTDKPQDAAWIPEDEKQALLAELAAENAVKTEAHVGPLKVLGNPKVLFLCAIYFMIQVSVYGVTFYLPTQVAGLLGRKVGFLVGVVSAIPWVCALLANATIPSYSDRSGKRGILAAFLMICAGFGVMISAVNMPLLAIVGLCVASAGYFSAQPIFWTMPSRFLTGVGAASAIALINSVGNLGGFIAPNLRVWAEQTFHNPSAGLYALGTASFIGAILFLISIPLGMGKNIKGFSAISQGQQVSHFNS